MAAMSGPSARWLNESGAELSEFALVLPLFLLVLLGIIDFGFLFQRYEVITNAELPGLPVRGPIGFQHGRGRVQFRNVFEKELR
jgi:hypothetical protein